MATKMSARYKAQKRATLLERHGPDCWLCGKPLGLDLPRTHARAATLDHVIPRSQGGTNELTNLRLAHRTCNYRRANAPATEPSQPRSEETP